MKIIRWTPVLTATSTALLALLAACGGSTQETGTTTTTAKASTTADTTAPPAAMKCAAGMHMEGTHCVADAQPEATSAPTAEAPKPPETKPETPAKPASPCPPEMAFVAGGNFKMGILKIDAVVTDLCMDKVETTAKEFETCVNDKKCTDSFVTCAPEATYKKAGKEDHPMVCVDFKQAIDYCTYRGKRLPSDEEWEWAARGGTEARLYPWGNEPPKDQVCWSGGGTARTSTCSVNEHPAGASKDGLLGMAGNVFEWTTNKQDSRTKDRVGRGGSWRDGLTNLMRNDRPGKFEVTYRCGFLGIRCVTAPQSPK